MSYPNWNDKPSEMVSMLRHAAMDAVLGQGGLVGQTLYAKAADKLHALETASENLMGLYRGQCPPNPRGFKETEEKLLAALRDALAMKP